MRGLEAISDKVAESLSKHEGELGLTGLTKLSDAAAEALSKVQGDLCLDGLTELSDAAAEALSKAQGCLALNGLTELSDAAAAILSKHQGELWLYGLTELSDAAAESLSKHQGQINGEGPQGWAQSRKAEGSAWEPEEEQDDSPSWDEVPEDRIVSPNEAGWIECPVCGIKFQEYTREWEDDVASHCRGHYFKRPR